jgi:hypothetical protein
VYATTRQKVALLLAGIPNLRIPRIHRYRMGTAPAGAGADVIAADIAARLEFPVILRQAMAHESTESLVAETKVAVLLAGPAELRAHLARSGWREFYAVEYVDLRRPDGCFRKLRAAIAGPEIILTQPAMYDDWMVTNWRGRPSGIAFYRAHPRAVEECNRIARDPEGLLGRETFAVLEAIRDRMPLHLFGVDFDVDAAGRVVLFEATAAMNLYPKPGEAEDIRLPDEPFERLDAAIVRLLGARLGEGPAVAP